MNRNVSGQSLIETAILTASIATGALTLWAVCHENITRFIETVLSVIASPTP